MKRIDRATEDRVIELYKIWESMDRVGELVGLARSTVRLILKRRHIKIQPRGGDRRGNGLNHSEMATILFMYQYVGYSSREIGETMNFSHDTILNRLKIAGVPRRTRSESIRLVAARRRAENGRAWGRVEAGVESGRQDDRPLRTVDSVGVPPRVI